MIEIGLAVSLVFNVVGSHGHRRALLHTCPPFTLLQWRTLKEVWDTIGRSVWTAARVTGPIEKTVIHQAPPWISVAGVSLGLDVGPLPAEPAPKTRKSAEERHLVALPQCATWIPMVRRISGGRSQQRKSRSADRPTGRRGD